MKYFLIAVCVNVRCDRDIRMPHQFFGHVDWDSGALKVGAEGMPETIGRQIRGNGMLENLAVPDFRAHMKVQSVSKGIPEPAKAVGTAYAAVGRGKHRRSTLAPYRQQALSQLLPHGDIPNPCGSLGGFDGPGPAFYGFINVDFISIKVNILPEQGRRLSRPQTRVQNGQHPQAGGMGLCHGQNVPAFRLGDGTMAPLNTLAASASSLKNADTASP